MAHHTTTAGNLFSCPEKRTVTTRLPAATLDRPLATLTQEVQGGGHAVPLLPPAPTPGSRLVALGVTAAQGVDNRADQAYMPYPHATTLSDAYRFLHLNNYILIQGGRIDQGLQPSEGSSTPRQGYWLTMWGGGTAEVTEQQVSQLLTLNYFDPDAVQVEIEEVEEVRDTLPCPPPQRLPLPGKGMYALVQYGVDIDYITDQQWKPVTFPLGIHQQVLYMGDLTLDGELWDCWWSLLTECYICQQVPKEELASRQP